MSRIREIRAKQERIARQIENEKRATPAPLPTPISVPGGPPVPIITGVPMLAQIREASVTQSVGDGIIQARLLNQFRAPYGETYDCYAFSGQDTSDLALFLPNLLVSDAVCINRLIDGNWYIHRPDFIRSSDCT